MIEIDAEGVKTSVVSRISVMKIRTDATGRNVLPTAEAIEKYRREGAGVVRRYCRAAGRELTLAEVVARFVAKDGEHRAGTISVYRAGLRQVISDAVSAGAISKAHAEELDTLAGTGPRPMLTGKKRTSGKKATSINQSDLSKLILFLRASEHDLDLFLAVYIFFGLRFFARPIEWSKAMIEEAQLVLTNAKTTNGRSHGDERIFVLTSMSAEEFAGLERFLADLARLADAYGSFEKMQKAIARRLTRVCKLAGVRPIAPTTLRHAGMAIAKTAESPEVVAYLAGHISLQTAGRHYGKKRTAIPGMKLEVSAPGDIVNGIRFTGTATRDGKPSFWGPKLA